MSIQRNANGQPIVYTDGACSSNGTSNAKAGVGVYWGPNHPDNVSRPLSGRQTNNRAEIQAAIDAVDTAHRNNYSSLDIRTDSQFMIDSVTKWMPNWKSNGWKLSNGEPVRNQADWNRLDNSIKKLDNVTWTKVKGHSGNRGNDMADRLANDAIE